MSKYVLQTTAFDRSLTRSGRRERERWERTLLRASVNRSGTALAYPLSDVLAKIPQSRSWDFSEILAPLDRVLPDFLVLGDAKGLKRAMHLLWRTVIGGSVATAAFAAPVAMLAAKGYVDHPASFWRQRIAERMNSPVFDPDKTLIGSVDTIGTIPPNQAADLAYIPLQGEVPRTFERGLLVLENQHFYDQGWRNLCGIDLLSLARPIVTFGRAGGSGLVQQLTKQLKQSEWGVNGNIFAKLYRGSMQLGAACSLYNTLVADGGKARVVREYANYAPMWQGNGVLRGIEAASNVVFGVAPARLTDAQQLILAAAVKEPLRIAPMTSSAIPCERVYPPKDNAKYDSSLASQHPARANQCRVLHRAISKARLVLSGPSLDKAIEELRSYQTGGIQPVNPFETISPKKLVNLSTRTRAAMSSSLFNEVRREAEALSQPGEPLVVSMDGVKQHDFTEAMKASLDAVQRSAKGRQILCMPLVENATAAAVLRKCGSAAAVDAKADVLALKVDVKTGSVLDIYASSPLLLDSTQSIGSLAKWVIVLAAVADGMGAETLVCPREAFDGARQLLRVEAPTQGYASCDKGKNLTSFEQATARSDNLAFYDLAKQLGRVKLANAAAALGFEAPSSAFNWEYELAFGTFGAKPRKLTGAAQRLLAIAYDTRLSGDAPHLLSNKPTTTNESTRALRRLVRTSEQREALRRLLAAPVTQARGTLSYLRGEIAAGKTGTTQSVAVDPTGRRFAHGKWSLTYQHESGELNLMMVASPLPSVPLAHHSIDGSLLAPALRTLLSANKD